MGKYLRPRRANEDKAIEKNILLRDGEMLMEFPEDGAIGKSAGRIVIGNGDNTYSEKVNASTEAGDFKPFITDPSIYQPIFTNSVPSEDYQYEDHDNGETFIRQIESGISKLPKIIELIKKTLCEHTDNIRYANDRISALEQGGVSGAIIGIKTTEYVLNVPQYVPSPYDEVIFGIALPEIDSEGYEFVMWTAISGSKGSYPVFLSNPNNHETNVVPWNNGYVTPGKTYKFYALYAKKNQ